MLKSPQTETKSTKVQMSLFKTLQPYTLGNHCFLCDLFLFVYYIIRLILFTTTAIERIFFLMNVHIVVPTIHFYPLLDIIIREFLLYFVRFILFLMSRYNIQICMNMRTLAHLTQTLRFQGPRLQF